MERMERFNPNNRQEHKAFFPADHMELFHCGLENCLPGHRFGPAVRDHYLLHAVLRGHGIFETDDKSYRLGPGDGFLIVPDVVTVYSADTDDPWHYGWIGLSGKDVYEVLRRCELSREQPIFHFSNPYRMHDILSKLYQQPTAETLNPFGEIALIYQFFGEMHISAQMSLPEKPTQRAVEYIERNYSYGITVQDIAHHAGLSRSQLFRQFERYEGKSPKEYLQEVRLLRAANLLREGIFTVTEVMYSSGFTDLPNFSRQFRKRFGLSPSACKAAVHKVPKP